MIQSLRLFNPQIWLENGRDHNRILRPSFKKIAHHTVDINTVKGRGITVQDLISIGIKKDNAEKLLNQSTKIGLLVPLDNKIGKQYQYAISNYKYVMDSKAKDNDEEEILP